MQVKLGEFVEVMREVVGSYPQFAPYNPDVRIVLQVRQRRFFGFVEISYPEIGVRNAVLFVGIHYISTTYL